MKMPAGACGCLWVKVILMTKLTMPFRFLTCAVIALAFLWTASASAFFVSFSKHQSSTSSSSNGPSITMSNQFDLSRISWSRGESVSPVSSWNDDSLSGIHRLLVTRITFASRGGWSSDGSSSFVDCYFPPREQDPRTPPSNAVPEPTAALLFAVGIGTAAMVRKRRS